jgi:predicted Zn-dependent peptidase
MKYHRTVLKNGLRVIAVPMPAFESATVLVMAGAGSRYENKKNSGISHFLEHMAFKGTESRPSAQEIASLVDGMGGEFNAFTGKEFTGYYIKSAADKVELCLDMLSDMLQNSLFDEKEITKEKGVIMGEINLYEDTPVRKIGDIYEQLLYGDTPLGWDIAGSKKTVMSVKRKDFVTYMQSLYSAHNLTVVVAGGIDTQKTFDLVEQNFGAMKKFDTIGFEKVTENQTKPQVFIKRKVTEQVHIALGFRTVPLEHEDHYPLELLSTIMGGGMSSRLFLEVREKRGLGYYVRTHSEHYQDCGTLVTTAGVDAKRVEEAIEVILAEHKIIADPQTNITDEELRKAKEYVKGHLVLELEDSRSVANLFANQELLEERIETPEEIIAKIEAVTAAQIKGVAQKYITQKTLNLALIGNFTSRKKFEKMLTL